MSEINKNQDFVNLRKTYFLLVGIFVVYFLLSSSAINEKLSAPGEMWILYVADRMTDGLIPYKDITIVYGPFVYLFNAFFLNMDIPFVYLKAIMLMVSISNGILVFSATKKIFSKNSMSVLATAIYMFIPLHYGIGPVIHLDQLAVLQGLLILNIILIKRKSFLIAGGIIGGLLYTTKVIAIPISFAPIIYFILNKKKEAIIYLLPLIGFIVIVYTYITSIKKYDLTQFYFDYVLKYPDTPYEHLRSFIWIEGVVTIFGVIGLIIFVRKYSFKSILTIMSLTSILPSLAFMIRGTGIYSANYIEPYVSILAAFSIFCIYDYMKDKFTKRKAKVICIIIICLIFIQFTIFDFPNRERVFDWQGERWLKSLNENTKMHTKLILENTEENDIVVTIPMAAFQTDRILALDEEPYSDILKIKKEILNYEDTNKKIIELKEMLKEKKIKLVAGGNTTTYEGKIGIKEELIFYYPFNLPELEYVLEDNYNEYFDGGYFYYTPKK